MTLSNDNRRRHMLDLLARYEAANDLEEEHRARMLSLLAVPGDPFGREHWVPGHFTASAFVLSPDRRRVLLVFHEKLRRWLQPGGHLEPGDSTLLGGALREVAEETAILDAVPLREGPLDVDVHRIPARARDPEHEHFDVRFLLNAKDDAFRAGSDALGARWVPLEDVAMIDTDESVMRAVRKIRWVVEE